NLSIPPTTRKLTITATPRDKELEPGGETTVDVELRDAAGKPARSAEVALVVVDESVLALSGYSLADHLHTSYFQRGHDGRNHHLRERVQLAKADALISQLIPGGGGRGAMSRDAATPIPMNSPAPPALARRSVAGEQAKEANSQMAQFADRSGSADQPVDE